MSINATFTGPFSPGPSAAGERLRASVRRLWRRLRGINERCVHLAPGGGDVRQAPRGGRVLLSYIIDGVLARHDEAIPHSHPHFWETRAMAGIFQEEGYAVDVIHWTRRGPLPRADYDIYMDVRRNFDRYAAGLPPTCLKIAHMDTAHYRVHNANQLRRLDALAHRRGVILKPFKQVEENRAAEQADRITVLGNAFTMETYAFAGKPIDRIRLSNAFSYPFPEDRDLETARKRFLWIGSEGFVHKGLDLVLEAFARRPDLELFVAGPLHREPAFTTAFSQWLYRTPNIHALGWVDTAGERFRELTQTCAAMVYPSCSEGGGGCVITAMHAGLIPVVTREASVDVDPGYGILLPDATVGAVADAAARVSALAPDALDAMARAAWRHARENHTRDHFKQDFRDFVRSLSTTRQESPS